MQKAEFCKTFCTPGPRVAVTLPLGRATWHPLQRKGNGWYCQFLHRGKRHTFAIGAVSEEEASAKAARVEELLALETGLVAIPAGVEVVEFVRHDGKPPGPRTGPSPPPRRSPSAHFRDRYLETHAPRSRSGPRRHPAPLQAPLLPGRPFPDPRALAPDLQGYVERRAKARGNRGRTLSPATIRKELVTLRTAWNWGVKMGHVAGSFPNGGLRYPKHDEKPPFQTREQIERQLAGLGEAGGPTCGTRCI